MPVGHAAKPVSGLLGVCLDVGIKLGKRHTAVSLRCRVGMYHVEIAGQLSAVAHKVPNSLSSLLDVSWSDVLIRRIVQRTILQHVVFEIGRIQLTDERTVHVERSDAVFFLDEVLRGGVGHILHIVLQSRQRVALVPQRKILFGDRRLNDGLVVIVLAA